MNHPNQTESIRQQWSHTSVAGHPGYQELLEHADIMEGLTSEAEAKGERVLTLLKEALDYRMDMAAYERIQAAINELQP